MKGEDDQAYLHYKALDFSFHENGAQGCEHSTLPIFSTLKLHFSLPLSLSLREKPDLARVRNCAREKVRASSEM